LPDRLILAWYLSLSWGDINCQPLVLDSLARHGPRATAADAAKAKAARSIVTAFQSTAFPLTEVE
jgi:hypothetical protein